MISVTQHITLDQAAELRGKLSALDPAYWRDRRTHKPNLGVQGNVGHYYSCAGTSLPKAIRESIETVIPQWGTYQLEEWVVNKTPAYGFMPPHVDNEGYFAVTLLNLQSGGGAFTWYREKDRAQPVAIADKAGQLIGFDEPDLLHSVENQQRERYVIIFLYR